MPKTWRPLEITNSPAKFGIRMKDDEHPSHSIDLPAIYDSEQQAREAITAWKDGEVKEKEKGKKP